MWIIKICTKILAAEHFVKDSNFGKTLLFAQVILFIKVYLMMTMSNITVNKQVWNITWYEMRWKFRCWSRMFLKKSDMGLIFRLLLYFIQIKRILLLICLLTQICFFVFFGPIVHLFSFVLRYPLRFPHKKDVWFVFTASL